MANKELADKIAKLLKEHGYTSYGSRSLPVEQAAWPTPEQSETPSNDQSIVTNGETTVMGEPRTDVAAQNGQDLDPDTMAEVGSLLITIGFILANNGHVSDKFNTPEVLDFLGTHFKVIPDQENDLDDEEPVSEPEAVVATDVVQPVETPAEIVPPAIDETKKVSMPTAYMEERKILESKFKK